MTASDISSFAIVPVGWWLFVRVYRWSQSRDIHHVSVEYVREMARKEANEAADVR